MHYSGGILSRATRRLSHDCISSLYHLHFTCISSYHPLLVCIYSYRPLFIHMSNEANEEHDVQQNCKTAKLQNFTSSSSPSISSSHHPHITQKSSQYHSNILIIWCILESPPCLDIIIIPVVLYHPHIMGGLSWAGHRCTTASTIEPCFHAPFPITHALASCAPPNCIMQACSQVALPFLWKMGIRTRRASMQGQLDPKSRVSREVVSVMKY